MSLTYHIFDVHVGRISVKPVAMIQPLSEQLNGRLSAVKLFLRHV